MAELAQNGLVGSEPLIALYHDLWNEGQPGIHALEAIIFMWVCLGSGLDEALS